MPCVNNSMVLSDGTYMDDVATAHCYSDYTFEDGSIAQNTTCQIKSHNNGSVYGEWTPFKGSCQRE